MLDWALGVSQASCCVFSNSVLIEQFGDIAPQTEPGFYRPPPAGTHFVPQLAVR